MTIAEVSAKYDLSIDTLRYYEKVGLIPTVRRSKSGIRDYGPADLNWVEFIKCMRSAGLSIDALLQYVTLYQMGESTAQERKAILARERDQLAARIEEMQNTLSRLDRKIEWYEQTIMKKEETLVGEGHESVSILMM